MTCQIPNGCIYDEEAGACPLCDEDGHDRIAEHYTHVKYHVVPIDDLRDDHSTDSDKPCWCRPREDEGVIVHNSLDGREKYETGERKMS